MEKKCKICGKKLQGNQRKYCSNSCKCKGYHEENKERNNLLNMNSYYRQTIKGYIRKLKLVKLSGGGCANCGYKKNLYSLNFHYKDASQKKFNLDARNISNRSWESVLEEYNKCVLLCSNCHGEIHNPEMDMDKIEEKIEESYGKIKILPPKTKKKIKKRCKECGVEITNKAILCKKCRYIKSRKVDRPSYKKLINEIEETNCYAVSKKYEVSSKTIKKWIKYYEKYEDVK